MDIQIFPVIIVVMFLIAFVITLSAYFSAPVKFRRAVGLPLAIMAIATLIIAVFYFDIARFRIYGQLVFRLFLLLAGFAYTLFLLGTYSYIGVDPFAALKRIPPIKWIIQKAQEIWNRTLQ